MVGGRVVVRLPLVDTGRLRHEPVLEAHDDGRHVVAARAVAHRAGGQAVVEHLDKKLESVSKRLLRNRNIDEMMWHEILLPKENA